MRRLRQARGEEGADPFAEFERPPTPLRLQVDREKAAVAARQGANPTATPPLPSSTPKPSGEAAAPWAGEGRRPDEEVKREQRRHRQRVLEWTEEDSGPGAMELHKELRAANRLVGRASPPRVHYRIIP